MVVDDLSAGFGERAVLKGLSFFVPPAGIATVLGPAGVGKSTLLRTLIRRNERAPSFWVRGHVWCGETDLLNDVSDDEARNFVSMMGQKTSLYTSSVLDNLLASIVTPMTPSERRHKARKILADVELSEHLEPRLNSKAVDLSIGLQRCMSLARTASEHPKVLLVDEPERDLPAHEVALVERTLRTLAQRFPILLVTHDQTFAKRTSHKIIFLVAGRVEFEGPTAKFFSPSDSPLIRTYLEQGNCWPQRPARDRRPSPVPPPPEPAHLPSGFHWVVPQLLGGMPRPGLLEEEELDLQGLRNLGIKILVSLEEAPFPQERVRPYGITVVHLPIADMNVPTLEAMQGLCAQIQIHLDAREPTVAHCKGGLGRTGTVLACVLIAQGASAVRALEEVRAICPRYVQSEEQVAFLARFEVFLRYLNETKKQVRTGH